MLHGKEKLWIVFWLYFLVGHVIALAVGASPILLGIFSVPFALGATGISTIYKLFSAFVLWRNALNTKWKQLGVLCRVLAIVYFAYAQIGRAHV